MKMKTAACAAVFATVLSGCVIAPPVIRPMYGPVYGPAYAPAYAPPQGIVYVAPTYALPAPGYAWQYQGQHGWGWRHPDRGWHRGWR